MDFPDLNFDLNLDLFADPPEPTEKEYIRAARIPYKPVCYKNAQEMAEDLDITQDYFCMVSGSFIFGDIFEALIDKAGIPVKKMYVSTLGMSEENVDSLVNLVEYLGVEELNLIVSSYFVGVERQGLIPYLIREFSGLPVKMAVVGSHAKIALIDYGENRLVIHGSANLSSSRNLETFFITHDPDVYDFVEKIYSGIMEKYLVIDGKENITIFSNNKDNRSQNLWKNIKEMLGDGEKG